MTPLDHPYAGRPHRVYAALTNHCNRACPWCSTCSSPRGSTWLSREKLAALLPSTAPFELQLEGGEPTLHPDFFAMVADARAKPNCTRIVVCTNGTRLPRQKRRLEDWLLKVGEPLTLKLSLNHYLLERDAGLLSFAALLVSLRKESIVLNVRLRRGVANDDSAVHKAVVAAGLLPHANVFFLQRYGFARDEEAWDSPFVVGDNFTLVNPDGSAHLHDLVARSEAMRALP